MGIQDDANNLDSALKRGTSSARSLGAEMLGIDRGLVMSVRHAVELGEALAAAAKVSESVGGPLVKILATVLSIGAAFAGWHQKAVEIQNQINSINAETERSNALARNDPRAASLAQINARHDEAIAQLKQEEGLMGMIGNAIGSIGTKLRALKAEGGITGAVAGALGSIIPTGGVHLYNYAGISAAIDERAKAETGELGKSIARTYSQLRAQLDSEIRKNDPELVKYSDEHRALALNEIARQDEVRHMLETHLGDVDPETMQKLVLNVIKAKDLPASVGGEFDATAIDTTVAKINMKFKGAADSIRLQVTQTLSNALTRGIADGLAAGIAAGIQAGSFEKGFRSLTGAILSGFGHLLVEIGTQTLLAANIFLKIVMALRALAPEEAIAASIAMIAFGGVLEGLGGSIAGGGGGGGGGYGGGYGGGGGGTVIDRGIINPLNSAPGVISGRSYVNLNATIIGVNDGGAQRMLQEMLRKANARGSA